MKYYIIYKPFGMLSQFTREGNHKTLADLNYPFEADVYPVGRLDADSEGLLLLTNDKQLNNKLLNPENKHPRTYLVQVEGRISEEAICKIKIGVTININGKLHITLPAIAEAPTLEPSIPERDPPIRFRRSLLTSWVYITLTEGKNRQVRKMTAATGFPTLRLIRVAIGAYTIGDMKPCDIKTLTEQDINKIFNLVPLKK